MSDIPEQEPVMSELNGVFASTRVVDRRASPSHGYRAVRVIVELITQAEQMLEAGHDISD